MFSRTLGLPSIYLLSALHCSCFVCNAVWLLWITCSSKPIVMVYSNSSRNWTVVFQMISSLKSYGCDMEDCLEKVQEAFSSPVRLFTECPASLVPLKYSQDQMNVTTDVLLTQPPVTWWDCSVVCVNYSTLKCFQCHYFIEYTHILIGHLMIPDITDKGQEVFQEWLVFGIYWRRQVL